MFEFAAIAWTLTAVLSLSAGFYVVQALRSQQIMSRINHGLSALMNVVMASMLWHLGATTMLVQIAVLTFAALWFVLQAVARPELKTLCPSHRGRLKCAYHSISMAGAALMVAMMMGHAASAGTGILAQSQTGLAGSHHTMAASSPSTGGIALADAPILAIVLTTLFGAAAVVFVVLQARRQLSKTSHRTWAARGHSVRAEHGFEAIGAAAMAVMFAAMA
ncbi:DUF5134 domain-containing protein [Cryobacterium sp. PH31-O1]|uniref:DUF5134 domain-containing protein n=1 Tax=Cryobacterium sp. PH31-O1 TaxID=3046306 RepID=UPI0024B90478|nr:DUF5134 domain-containing protein [Cryobacterium sp. PH31-O1]MDJ0338399.1 DUF5134 domain-containing protein [Cryobacterium sp. PH31-O1]